MKDSVTKLKKRTRAKVGSRHVTWHHFVVEVEGDFGEANRVEIRVALIGGSKMRAEVVGRGV